MRNMSFMLTTQQVRNGTKTVTRRLGWWNLKSGELVFAVEKCQGLKKGEKIKRIRPIRILNTQPEMLCDIMLPDREFSETAKEGFPGMSGEEFVVMFCRANKCQSGERINRIEFEYV